MRCAASAFVSVVIPSTFQLELFGDFGGQPRRLSAVACHVKCSALDDARIDAFARGNVDDLVHGVVEGLLPGQHAVAPVQLRHPVAVSGYQPGQPSAVAARGAEPGEPRLQHDDPQRRIGPLQVVRRPQPGVAGADDAHIGVPVAGQRRTHVRKLGVPVGDAAVDHMGHRPILAGRLGGVIGR